MSKAKRVRRNGDESAHNERDGVIVTTSRGQRVECLPIAAMLDEIRAQLENDLAEFEIPSHAITDVAGVTVEIQYNEESIKNAPPEDQAKWIEYISAKTRLESESKEHQMRIVATKGVVMLDMPPDDVWIAEHEWLGYHVPTFKPERLYHYFKTEVVGTNEDGLKISAGIYRASGIDEEVIRKVEASFRASMGKPEGKDAGTDTPDSESDESRKENGLVEQSELHD